MLSLFLLQPGLELWLCLYEACSMGLGKEFCVFSLFFCFPSLVGKAILTTQTLNSQSLSSAPLFCVDTGSSVFCFHPVPADKECQQVESTELKKGSDSAPCGLLEILGGRGPGCGDPGCLLLGDFFSASAKRK